MYLAARRAITSYAFSLPGKMTIPAIDPSLSCRAHMGMRMHTPVRFVTRL